MDRSVQGFRVRLAKAAALLVFVGSAAPQALAQLLPPLPLPGGSLIVTITSPGSGSTVANTVPVSASVSIVGSLTVASVQFKLDGANLGALDTSAPYSVSWNTTTAGNGSHTLTAVARDILGVQFTSAPVTVTVNNAPPPPPPDTTPPTVSITAPASGATVSGTTSVTASASDNVRVVGVQFKLDGINLGAEDTAAPYSVSWNTTSASDGSHTLSAVARDAAGNVSPVSAVTVTVNNAPPPPPPDTTPPTVSITAPASGATVSGTTSVTASASDNVRVVGVQFKLDGSNLGAEDTTAPYSVSWNTTTTSNGSHTLSAVARDAAGNVSPVSAVTVTVNNAPPPPPPDTTPPTVSITAPSNGATVKGTATVTATASDNVGVVGVQFLLDDGANGSADVTTAPYSISWNTATASDGSHKITAIARDAAGNRSPVSAPVTVTVANNTAPPPASTRFEDTDPSVVYSGPGWRADKYAALSNGGATATDQAGAQATFTFTGTSVSWIGGRWVEEGIAQVFLDGSFVAQVDTYSKTKEVQVPLFTALDLADTSHTLTIEVTGQKNVASTLAFVIVDAFDVPAATISRLQDTDPSVAFTGSGWLQGVTGVEYSGGTVAGSLTAGDQATFTFAGTGVRWLGELGPDNGGIAHVSLDGAFMKEVDTYAPSPDPAHHSTFQAEHFKATGLADTSHTLTIEVTGRQDPAAATAIVLVDAFDVITSGTRREETDPAITYSAGWLQGNRDHPYSEGTAAVSTIPGDRATFTFTGTSVSWIGYRGPQAGIARVILDGTVVADSLDMFIPFPSEAPQKTVFTSPPLAAGSHTLTIEVTGSKNPASAGVSIVVDAFDVTP